MALQEMRSATMMNAKDKAINFAEAIATRVVQIERQAETSLKESQNVTEGKFEELAGRFDALHQRLLEIEHRMGILTHG